LSGFEYNLTPRADETHFGDYMYIVSELRQGQLIQ
jgi:hypothetical protein